MTKEISVFVKKANQSYMVDFSSLPETSQTYIISYGLRQSLADAAASAENATQALGMIEKRFDSIKSGTMGMRAESTNPVDAVEREAFLYAMGLLRKKLGTKFPKDQLEEKAHQLVASEPKLLELAKKSIAAKQEARNLQIEVLV